MINLEASKNIHLSTYPDEKFDTQPLEKFVLDLSLYLVIQKFKTHIKYPLA